MVPQLPDRRLLVVNLGLLEAAFKPIVELASDEVCFEVEGVQITLRALTQREEIAVQRIIADSDKESEEEGQLLALEYFTKFRIEVLAYAIVEVNGIDLRNERTLASSEVGPNGQPIRVEKHVGVRTLLGGWPRAAITFAFAKYGEVTRLVSEKTEKLLEQHESDLDAEIDRLETRLATVRQQRASMAAGNPLIPRTTIDTLVRHAQAEEIVRSKASIIGDAVSTRERAPSAEPEPEPQPPDEPIPTPAPRKPVIPPSSPPPSTPATAASFEDFISSFGESDLESMAAEESRILRSKLGETPSDPLSQAKPVGRVNNLDAYRLPAEVISERGRAGVPQAQVAPSTANPNFRSPKR